jgi:hypothetical protein
LRQARDLRPRCGTGGLFSNNQLHHQRSFAMATAKRTAVRGKRATKMARAKPKPKPHANSRTKPLPRPHGNRIVFSPALIADIKRRYENTPETFESLVIDLGASRSTLRNIALSENWVRYVPPPRGLSRAAEIAAEAEALEALTLPPPSARLRASSTRYGGGEGGSGARERDGVGWGEACEQTQTPPTSDGLLPPTPNPSPPLAALVGGGEKSAAPPATPAWSMRERIDELRHAVDEEIAAVRALRANLKGVPHSTETAGRTSRTLADLTTTLERLHRLEIGASQHNGQEAYADNYSDMPADPDAFRDELARRIRAFVASRTGARDADGNSAPVDVDEIR